MTSQGFLSRCRERVDQELAQRLPRSDTLPEKLHEALRYTVLSGGKRIRAMLTYATCDGLGGEWAQADDPACAVELIHAYSLIHDDLPAMDDDDLRRGKPTCHKVYGEAVAILAGDALQALAFAQLASPKPTGDGQNRLHMIRELARASGSEGMVGGQCIDLQATARHLSLPQLEQMHRYKTGALIEASVLLGALAAGCDDANQLAGLRRFASSIGLAFQIKDDLLDVESNTESLGKSAGADASLKKATYPALLGLEPTREKAEALYRHALEELDDLGLNHTDLATIAALVVHRQH